MFEVIDNFLDKKNFKNIQENIFYSENFPWYFGPVLDYVGEKGFDQSKFVHVFYSHNSPNSKSMDLLLPIIKKLKCISLIRIKANSNYYTNKIMEGKYHIDNKHKGTTTAIYYLNTNDGYTKFKNKGKVKSVENRMVVFPSNLEHQGYTCSDKLKRVVVNFNYDK